MSVHKELVLDDLAPLLPYFNDECDDLLSIIQDLSHAVFLLHGLKARDYPELEIENVCSTIHGFGSIILTIQREKLI